jgi:hypothetical protein
MAPWTCTSCSDMDVMLTLPPVLLQTLRMMDELWESADSGDDTDPMEAPDQAAGPSSRLQGHSYEGKGKAPLRVRFQR